MSYHSTTPWLYATVRAVYIRNELVPGNPGVNYGN